MSDERDSELVAWEPELVEDTLRALKSVFRASDLRPAEDTLRPPAAPRDTAAQCTACRCGGGPYLLPYCPNGAAADTTSKVLHKCTSYTYFAAHGLGAFAERLRGALSAAGIIVGDEQPKALLERCARQAFTAWLCDHASQLIAKRYGENLDEAVRSAAPENLRLCKFVQKWLPGFGAAHANALSVEALERFSSAGYAPTQLEFNPQAFAALGDQLDLRPVSQLWRAAAGQEDAQSKTYFTYCLSRADLDRVPETAGRALAHAVTLPFKLNKHFRGTFAYSAEFRLDYLLTGTGCSSEKLFDPATDCTLHSVLVFNANARNVTLIVEPRRAAAGDAARAPPPAAQAAETSAMEELKPGASLLVNVRRCNYRVRQQVRGLFLLLLLLRAH